MIHELFNTFRKSICNEKGLTQWECRAHDYPYAIDAPAIQHLLYIRTYIINVTQEECYIR